MLVQTFVPTLLSLLHLNLLDLNISIMSIINKQICLFGY